MEYNQLSSNYCRREHRQPRVPQNTRRNARIERGRGRMREFRIFFINTSSLVHCPGCSIIRQLTDLHFYLCCLTKAINKTCNSRSLKKREYPQAIYRCREESIQYYIILDEIEEDAKALHSQFSQLLVVLDGSCSSGLNKESLGSKPEPDSLIPIPIPYLVGGLGSLSGLVLGGGSLSLEVVPF